MFTDRGILGQDQAIDQRAAAPPRIMTTRHE
jgi:hypothetical protein